MAIHCLESLPMTQSKAWSDSDRLEDLLDQLVALSRYYGSDPEFIRAGGGNTSYKTEDRLWIKASGYHLERIGREGFVEMDRARLASVLEVEWGGGDRLKREAQFEKAVLDARAHEDEAKKPSIETMLHHQVPAPFVVHSHATLINMLACCVKGEALTGELFGDEVAWMPYEDPGLARSAGLGRTLEAHRARTGQACPRGIIMENHGPVVCGERPGQIRETTEWMTRKVRERLGEEGVGAEPFGAVRLADEASRRQIPQVGVPLLETLLREPGRESCVVRFDDTEPALALAGGAQGREAALGGPQTPHQVTTAGAYPLWLKAGDMDPDQPHMTAQTVHHAIKGHMAAHRCAPKVVIVEGVGIFYGGPEAIDAVSVEAFYRDAIQILAGSRRLGGARYHTAEEIQLIEAMGYGSYRITVDEGEHSN